MWLKVQASCSSPEQSAAFFECGFTGTDHIVDGHQAVTSFRLSEHSHPIANWVSSVAYHAPRHEYDRNDACQGGYDGGDSRNASVDAVARDASQRARAGGIFVVLPVASVVNATVQSAGFSKPRRHGAGRGTRWIGDLPSGDLPHRSIPRRGCSLHRFHHFGVLPQMVYQFSLSCLLLIIRHEYPPCLSRPANLTAGT